LQTFPDRSGCKLANFFRTMAQKKNNVLKFDFGEKDIQELFLPFDPQKIANAKLPKIEQQLPIVLSHGIARPDYLIDSIFRTLNLSLYDFSFVSDRFHYFRGIASHLKKHGFEVYHTSVSFAAGVETRAKDLRKEILKVLEKTGSKKVHIIAHSMGGLDARWMIVHEEMEDRIASLTTIATPHWGTSVADFALKYGIEKVIGILGKIINFEGIKSCTFSACMEFNGYVRNHEATNDVLYQVYYSSQVFNRTFLPFQVAWKILDEREGENDGLISVKSQRWTPMLVSDGGTIKVIPQNPFPIPADHMDEMGWWNLNEIHKAGWWNLRALREKNSHEEIIKNVYLKIAREVNELTAGSHVSGGSRHRQ